MIDTIIVAAISFLGTIVGALSGAKLTNYRIKLLEKKVDKHNHFAERMLVEEQIKVINHRIDDLEDERR